ncbi:MAG: hypothetical protein NVS1B13_10340 [Flavisolibacter sp.]
MKKITLQFLSLFELASFAKLLKAGYITNTTNFTITIKEQVIPKNIDLNLFRAKIIETTEKVFTYQYEL